MCAMCMACFHIPNNLWSTGVSIIIIYSHISPTEAPIHKWCQVVQKYTHILYDTEDNKYKNNRRKVRDMD